MPLKRILLAFLIITTSNFVVAQDSVSLREQVDKLDSLVFYNNFTMAEAEANRLYEVCAKKGKACIDLKLMVQLQQANIHARNEHHSKAIKLVLNVIDEAKQNNLHELEYKACLAAALAYEVAEQLGLCKSYLNRAYKLYATHGLDSVYSLYCIRSSSYYRFANKKDSAIYFAKRGLAYAKKYKNEHALTDAYLLLGIFLYDSDYQEAIKYYSLATRDFLGRNDYDAAASMYSNIAAVYQSQKNISKAFLYNDSAMWLYKKYPLPEVSYSHTLKQRSRLFDSLGNKDSAYVYFQQYHTYFVNNLKEQEASEIKKITEQYHSEKKEVIIKNKNQQLLFIISIAIIIAIATVLLLLKNRKINKQNKTISKQVDDLVKAVEQKQVLLSELQHRVKNNLQHVISILEIQKESADFNNIDELIRGNQNRIHSLALLHKKLDTAAHVNTIDLPLYISELAELIKNSYADDKKKINLEIQCSIEYMSLTNAQPIGLIIVELISNSIKHAFKNKEEGTIKISLTKDILTQKNKLHYTDNGTGFNFNLTAKKGLGLEIIKGLIDQLDGTIETIPNNGFELIIYFQKQ